MLSSALITANKFTDPKELDYLPIPDCGGYKYHKTDDSVPHEQLKMVEVRPTGKFVNNHNICPHIPSSKQVYIDDATPVGNAKVRSAGCNGTFVTGQEDVIQFASHASGKPSKVNQRYSTSLGTWCKRYAWVYITTDLSKYYYVPAKYYRNKLEFHAMYNLHYFVNPTTGRVVFITMVEYFNQIKDKLSIELSQVSLNDFSHQNNNNNENQSLSQQSNQNITNTETAYGVDSSILAGSLILHMRDSIKIILTNAEDLTVLLSLAMTGKFYLSKNNNIINVRSRIETSDVCAEVRETFPGVTIWSSLLVNPGQLLFSHSQNYFDYINLFNLNIGAQASSLFDQLSSILESSLLSDYLKIARSTTDRLFTLRYVNTSNAQLDEGSMLDLRQVINLLLFGDAQAKNFLLQYCRNNSILNASQVMSRQQSDSVCNIPVVDHTNNANVANAEETRSTHKKRPAESLDEFNTPIYNFPPHFVIPSHLFHRAKPQNDEEGRVAANKPTSPPSKQSKTG